MNPSASDTPVGASQLSVQLVAARFKGAGIVPVGILSLVLSIDLTVGFLAPRMSSLLLIRLELLWPTTLA